MSKWIFLIITIIFTPGCNKNEVDNSNGDEYLDEYRPNLSNKIVLNKGNLSYMDTPMLFEDVLICFIEDAITDEGWINAYDKNTLELLWTWNDAHTEYGAKGFGQYSYIYQGVLCTSQSNLSYGINISDGSTLWHQRAESGRSSVFGIEDRIFKNTSEVFNSDATLRAAHYLDGNWDELHTIVQDDSLYVQRYNPELFEWNGIRYAAFVTSKWLPSPSITNYWLSLFSLTENKLIWKSDTIPKQFNLSGIPGTSPVFTDGQILLGNDAVYSYNVEDGSLEWWKHYGNNFTGLNSQMFARDGVLYANNEDSYLAAWDVHTGDEIFNVESGGICSQIQICDNRLYQTSYSKNVFFVYDSRTGEKLYEVEAPYYERFTENDRLFFENVMVVDPETCLAYTTDKKHLLVYEFE